MSYDASTLDSSKNDLADLDHVEQSSTLEVIADFNSRTALVAFDDLIPLINNLNEAEKIILIKLMEKIDNLNSVYLNLEKRIDSLEKTKSKSYSQHNLPFTDKEVVLFEGSSFFGTIKSTEISH